MVSIVKHSGINSTLFKKGFTLYYIMVVAPGNSENCFNNKGFQAMLNIFYLLSEKKSISKL